MIKFKTITLQNFLSFGKNPTTVNLDTDIVSLIMGENKDVGAEGYSRNGVGKSTIFQAIAWCLFNEGVTNIKQDSFINITNKKKMVVEMVVDVKGTELVIRRGRKPNFCEITKDGELYTLHSSKSTDESIKELLGMDIDIFLNTVLLTTNTTSFMAMKPMEQRNFMEHILALHILSKRADKLKSFNKDNAVEIKLEDQNREHIERTNDRIANSLREMESKSTKWLTDNLNQIEENNASIATMEAVDTDKEIKLNEELESFKKEKSSLEEQIEKLGLLLIETSNKYDTTYDQKKLTISSEFDKKISALDLEKANNRESIYSQREEDREKVNKMKEELKFVSELVREESDSFNRLMDESEKYAKQKKSLLENKCPFCKQPFHGEDKLEDIEYRIEGLDKSSEVTIKKLSDLVDNEDGLGHHITEAEEAIKNNYDEVLTSNDTKFDGQIIDLRSERMDIIEKISLELSDLLDQLSQSYDSNLETLKIKLKAVENNMPNPTVSISDCERIIINIENLKKENSNLENQNNPYTDQIEIMRKDIVKYDESKSLALIKNESHYKMLIKLLTDSKSFVRKNLIDQYVPFINQKINGYLEELDSPHKVSINSDLTVDVDYMRQNISFGNLSNGEKLRVNIATSFAFRELLALSGCKNNLLLIDELLDSGGDSSFFYNVFKILKARSKESVFIISHRDELIPEVDKLITIEKEGGFSRIKA